MENKIKWDCFIIEKDEGDIKYGLHNNRKPVIIRKRNGSEYKFSHKSIHPHFAGWTENQGESFDVFETYPGKPTLGQILKSKQKLSCQDKLDISLKVSEALEYLHSLDPSMIHENVSPNSVLVDIELAVYVLSCEAERFPKNCDLEEYLAWKSPEFLTGKPVWTQSDVFSFGLLMYELFTENTIPARSKENGYMFPKDKLSEIRKNLPQDSESKKTFDEISDIITQSLQQTPSLRLNTMQISSKLEKILKSLPTKYRKSRFQSRSSKNSSKKAEQHKEKVEQHKEKTEHKEKVEQDKGEEQMIKSKNETEKMELKLTQDLKEIQNASLSNSPVTRTRHSRNRDREEAKVTYTPSLEEQVLKSEKNEQKLAHKFLEISFDLLKNTVTPTNTPVKREALVHSIPQIKFKYPRGNSGEDKQDLADLMKASPSIDDVSNSDFTQVKKNYVYHRSRNAKKFLDDEVTDDASSGGFRKGKYKRSVSSQSFLKRSHSDGPSPKSDISSLSHDDIFIGNIKEYRKTQSSVQLSTFNRDNFINMPEANSFPSMIPKNNKVVTKQNQANKSEKKKKKILASFNPFRQAK